MQQKTSISVLLKRFSFINSCILETASFHLYIVYQRNKLFMGKYLFLSLFYI